MGETFLPFPPSSGDTSDRGCQKESGKRRGLSNRGTHLEEDFFGLAHQQGASSLRSISRFGNNLGALHAGKPIQLERTGSLLSKFCASAARTHAMPLAA